MNLAEWLLRTAQRSPDGDAIFDGTAQFANYEQFADRACRFATGLQMRGLRSGDRIAIFTPNCPDYLPILFAIWIAGGIAVPINAKLHPREAAWIIENSGARFAFVSKAQQGTLKAVTPCALITLGGKIMDEMAKADPAALVEKAPDDLAWLFYTSGTTGRPKGVEITHGMLAKVSLAYLAEVDETQADHCAIYAAPLTHGAGLYGFAHVLKGARHVVPRSGGFDPREVFELAQHFGKASLFAAPTMVKRLVTYAKETGTDAPGLKTVIYGGGPMYVADIIEAVDLLGPRFAQIYGQGECPMCITVMTPAQVADRTHPNWRARLGSVGVAQSICEVRIVAGGAVLPSGEIGEIQVRSEAVMPGYWNNPLASAQALSGDWLNTGDMGALDEDGFLTLHDRSKDMIISGGTNIYPREIEELLLTHKGVDEVAVIGREHPEWGEEVVAIVIGTATPVELDALCLSEIARFKRPKAYYTMPELPKNNYGKVVKTELRTALVDGTLRELL